MIFLFLFSFQILFIFSQPPREIDIPEIKACYQSIEHPDIFYDIVLPFPSAPWYIIADIEYNLFPVDEAVEPITDWVIHHLILVDRECTSSVHISDGGVKFRSWTIRINTYLDYFRQSPFLDFYYDFDQDFKYDIQTFADVHEKAYLAVIIEPGKEHLPPSDNVELDTVMTKLQDKRVEFEYICVTVDQNHFIIKPYFEQTKPKIGHISAITARVYQDGDMDGFVSWTAYGCRAKRSRIPGDIYFVTSRSDINTTIFYTLRFVDSEMGANPIEYDDLKDVTKFVCPDIDETGIDQIDHKKKWAKKIYMMYLNRRLEQCPGGDDQYGFLTRIGKRIYGYRYSSISPTIGVKQIKKVLLPGSKKCPREK